MKLFDIPFKLSEEFLDTALYFLDEKGRSSEELVFKSIGKTESYIKKAVTALTQLNILNNANKIILLNKEYINSNLDKGRSILKKAILIFAPFNQFMQLLQNGKSKGAALKIVKAVHGITNDIESIGSIFTKYKEYLDMPELTKQDVKVPIKPVVSDSTSDNQNFISLKRIIELKTIVNTQYDLAKLIRICEELNDNYTRENYYSTGLLVRVILDHIPPAFKKRTFSEVANNYGSKSFKDVMGNLENFNRKIADGFLHGHMKRKESLPNHITVECRNAIDILLGEAISELNYIEI